MNYNQIDTSNFTEYQNSVNQKCHIMNGLFHNMTWGMKAQEINPVTQEFVGTHMLANPFLSAIIFELAIKSMWELSHLRVFGRTEINQYGHYIDRIYSDLEVYFCEFILNKYDAEVTYFSNALQEYLNSYQCKNLTEVEKASILSCPYFSFQKCLEENPKIVTSGKYEFERGNKINIITGIIPNPTLKNDQVQCYRQPSPFLIEIMDHIRTQLL